MGRRELLRTLGLSAAALPFLPMLEAEVEADGEFPKRLVLVYTPDGTPPSAWRPTGNSTDFELSRILLPLEAMRDKIVVVDGLRASRQSGAEDHASGMAALWTGSSMRIPEGGDIGWASSASVDQRIVDALRPSTPFRSLQFGVLCGDPAVRSRTIYSGSESPLHPIDNPHQMFDYLYSTLELAEDQFEQMRARKKSVLDAVKTRLSTIGVRIGAGDRHKFDAHLEGIREIERRLETDVSACAPPDISELMETDYGNAMFPEVGDAQMRLLASALACDATRFASLQWSRAFSGVRHEWIGKTESHHHYSHDGVSDEPNVEIDRWYAEKFRDLLLLLDSYPEGNGTLLDNTIVVWGRELPTPWHAGYPFPIVMAGGGGGRIETGRYLNYDQTPHAALLVSICHAMGLPEIESIGDVDPDTGPLQGLVRS